MKQLLGVLMIGMVLMCNSCATIFTGTKDTLRFTSSPSGATVYLDGIELCKTPCSMPIKRSLSSREVSVELEGYETRLITLDKEFNVVSVLNLFSLFAWIIDAGTGAMMKYDRKFYEVDLKEERNALLDLDDVIKYNINTRDKTVEVFVVK